MRTRSVRLNWNALASACALATQLTTSSALACSGGPTCTASGLLPATGELPANAVEFLWSAPVRTGEAEPSLAGIHLYRVQSGLRAELPTRVMRQDGLVHVVPRDPPESGAELVLETGAAPCLPAVEASGAMIRVTASAPKPSELGTVRAAGALATSLQLAVNSGECSRFIKTVSAEITLTLSDAARPYGALLRHALLIDGVEAPQLRPAYPATTTSPNGKLENNLTDRIFALCDEDAAITQRGLAQGTHRVQWLSRLADGTELKSAEISVALQCPASTTSDSGVDAGDASTSEAGTLLRDAGTGDAGRDAAAMRSPWLMPGDDSPPPRDASVDTTARVDASVNVCWEGCSSRYPSEAVEHHDDGCSLIAGRQGPRGALLSGLCIVLVALLTRRRLREPPCA